MTTPLTHAVVLGGRGGVGRLFAGLLRQDAPVVSVDIRPTGGPEEAGRIHHVVGDACAPNHLVREALAGTDVVLLALPGRCALRAVDAVAPCMRPGAAIADTLSVKHQISQRLEEAARRYELEALSVNPMFAPDLGFDGRPVAVVDVAPGPVTARLRELIALMGSRLVTVSARQHDELTASLQAATHAAILGFGSALRQLGMDVETLLCLAPPPHRLLLALLARICSGSPDVYLDVQHANPRAARARAALTTALRRFDDLVRDDADGFATSMTELADWLGPHRDRLAEECAQTFDSLPSS